MPEQLGAGMVVTQSELRPGFTPDGGIVQNRHRLPKILGVAAVVAGSLFVTSEHSSASATTSAGATVESAQYNGDSATLEGVVPSDLGSDVTVSAMISPTGVAEHVGEDFPAEVVGTTSPDSSTFELSLKTNTNAMAHWASVNGGYLNLLLVANGTADDGASESRMSMQTFKDQSPSLEDSSQNPAQLLTMPSKNIHWGPLETVGNPSEADVPKDWHGVPCGYHTVYTTNDWARVGYQQDDRDASSTFTYGRTADSSIGISINGSNGSAGASGSATVGNSLAKAMTIPVGPHTANYMLTEFQGVHTVSDKPPEGTYCTNAGTLDKASRWGGGDRIGARISQGSPSSMEPLHNVDGGEYPCVPSDDDTTTSYTKGASWSTQNETSDKFDFGLTLTFPDFNVGLSTHQGYGADTGTTWKYGYDYSLHYTCGVHTLPSLSTDPYNGPAEQ